VIPWRFRDFDYWDMIRDIEPELPYLKHVLVIGDEVPPGAISISEMSRRPLSQARTSLLRERRFSAFEVSRIRHTTGSTGFPKLIEETNSNRIYLAKELTRLLKITDKDVIGALVQITGGGGSYALLCAPWVGAKSVLMEHFQVEECFRLIERERITVAGVVPAILAMMIQHPSRGKYDLSSLRALASHGAPLPSKLAQEAEEKLGCLVLNRYGMADGGSMSMASVEDPPEARHRTVGRPHTGNEFRIIGEDGNEVPMGQAGEVLFRGPGTHAGFFKDQERTAQTYKEDGWFATGDVGRLDDHGRLVLVDRLKDLIIRGGENIYPSEIEDIIMTNPKVANAAVVGMPDPVMGEKACAYLVLKPGETMSFDEMTSFLKSKALAPFKLPERLEILDHFELVSDQKVDKKVLRRDIQQKLEREGKL
jgi:non-ribosomal peptide synthetase component E (peptide arylation enzyme)